MNCLIYAELVTHEIKARGVFYSLSEFLPYRAKGWTATPEYNKQADERLEQLRNTPDRLVNYYAPMIRFGEDYRFEQIRRRQQ